MSDYMAAEITLGGPVPHRLVGKLCAAIVQEGVSLEWGDASYLPTSAYDLLSARREEHGAAVLALYADEAPYGQFQTLEEFLLQHRLAYRRFSDGKYEFDAEIVEHRPALGTVRYFARHNGEPLVSLAKYRGATRAIEEVLSLLGKRRLAAARQKLTAMLRILHSDMPPEIPPLEPFEIVKGGRRVIRT